MTGGHQGFNRTYQKIADKYYWQSLREDCMKFVSSCDSCQRSKASTQRGNGLLTALPIPNNRFETIGIDFAVMPMSTSGFDAILVVHDKLTKLVNIIATMLSFRN